MAPPQCNFIVTQLPGWHKIWKIPGSGETQTRSVDSAETAEVWSCSKLIPWYWKSHKKVVQITWKSYSKMEVNLFTNSLMCLMNRTETEALGFLPTTVIVMDANNAFNKLCNQCLAKQTKVSGFADVPDSVLYPLPKRPHLLFQMNGSLWQSRACTFFSQLLSIF